MKHPILLLLLLLITTQSIAAIRSLDTIIVVVNDDVITQQELSSEVNEYIIKLRLKNLSDSDKQSLKKQVLEKMIRTKIQLQRAKKLGISVDAFRMSLMRGRNALKAEEIFREIKRDDPRFESARADVENQYTQLKNNLEKQGDYHHAGDFHYGEQEMRRMDCHGSGGGFH